jgi:uncharacterized protein YneF (UPF0154 family)
MPGVVRTEIAVILIVIGVAVGWALGQMLTRKIGLSG